MLAIPHHSQVFSMAVIDSKEAQKKLKAGICFYKHLTLQAHLVFVSTKKHKLQVEEKNTSAINRAFYSLVLEAFHIALWVELRLIPSLLHATGHYARDCQKPSVRDAKYFREQMLLAMKDEAGSNLNDEENDFMLDNSDKEKIMEELTAIVMLMA
ncbi:hypothetical protein Tco_0608330 [Tanacetum coccineum]